MTPEQFREEFERVWPWLEPAVKAYADTSSKDDVWTRISDGRADLWTTQNAAVVTTIEVMMNGKKSLNGWLAGGDLADIQQLEPMLADWGRHQGCEFFTLVCRPGFERKLSGFSRKAVILIKDLTP